MRIRLTRQDKGPVALAGLEARWRELEGRADPSLFQSWSWVGCQAARFTDPHLLEALDESGDTLALALLNRRGRRVFLHETGDPALDAPFIEHNAPLVAIGHGGLLPALFEALPASLTANGVDAVTAGAAVAGRAVLSRTVRSAPILDLSGPVLESVSANTGAQLRRAMRRYSGRGALGISRAETAAAARDRLGELIRLHDVRWRARGQPGAFADPRTVAFHHALIERGVPRGEVDLLHVEAGEGTVGFLYNLCLNGRVFAYQAGFAYEEASAAASPGQLKPGLVCHALAAEWYRGRGARSYDFGAGDARYKRSLANGSAELHWLTLASPWSAAALVRRGVRLLGRAAGGA